MKRFLLLFVCLSAVVVGLGSCRTLVKTEIEYVVPELNFPTWPNPGPVDFPFEDGVISVPVDYFRQLYDYKKDIEGVEEYYSRCKELYLEGGLNGRKE